MQNFIQIPQKMKTGVQNAFKWENSTLPFWIKKKEKDEKLYFYCTITQFSFQIFKTYSHKSMYPIK